jgi:hypothetical protein
VKQWQFANGDTAIDQLLKLGCRVNTPPISTVGDETFFRRFIGRPKDDAV